MYLLSTRQKQSSVRRDFNRLLHATFTTEDSTFVSGDPNWHVSVAAPEKVSLDRPLTPLPGTPHAELLPDFPSRRLAMLPFGKDAALSLGTEAHELLAGIGWNDEAMPSLDNTSTETASLLKKFLKSQAAGEIFARPGGLTDLWREQSFDVLLDGRWISGVFDRVVFANGHAEILDYKTGGDELAATYGEQMDIYRRSLAVLCGMPLDAISTSLVDLRSGRKIPVGAPRKSG
jgi:hypothetical protein